MSFGVRKKLVLFLVVVALLPLIAATVTIAFALSSMRITTLAQSSVSLAQAEATGRSISLSRDMELIQIAMREPTIIEQLKRPTQKKSDQELARLDAAWQTMPDTAPAMAAVLNNEAAEILRQIKKDNPRFGEILLTDHFGQLVAASGRTSDYYQADEDWWTRSYDNGKGRIVVETVAYDSSVGAYGIEVAIPIGQPGKVLGVAKVVLHLDHWMEQISPSMSGMAAGLMLVREDGTVLYRKDTTPLTTVVPHWDRVLENPQVHHRLTDEELQGYARIELPAKIGDFPVKGPAWWMVIYTPRSVVMTPIWSISAITLGVGLALVLILFLLGLLLIERSITRRVMILQQAVSRVAKGDLNSRVQMPRHRLLGVDELDALAGGLNQMIDNVQKTTQALQSANELKTDFIRIAGHELRTPISYILGMARLLKDSTDSTRLLFAVQSMGSKAKRLNEIIQAMFKLMPTGLHREDLHYTDVDLSVLLEELYIDVFPFVEKRNQRLLTNIVDTIPPLRLDREKLRDILENLLMNAIKFTPDGGIIKVRASLALGDRVTVSVQDQGPGIPEQEYPRLFQPFYSGGDVMTHSTGDTGYQKRGIGLGLAIVRHFTELQRGTVHVTSSPLGSTFSITLPIRPPDELTQGPGEQFSGAGI